MAVKIYEGVVERTSQGTITNGQLTTYEFIEIGGERIMKVQATNLLDTFIKVGDNVAISCHKGWAAPHKVCAVREPDGRITKMEKSTIIFGSAIMFGSGVVLALIPMIFAFALFSPILVLAIWFGFAAGLSHLVMKDYYKARNALDTSSTAEPLARQW